MINLRGFKYGTCDVVTLHLHYLEKLISTAYEIDFVLSVCEEVYRDVRKLQSCSTVAVQLCPIMGFYLKFLGSFPSF